MATVRESLDALPVAELAEVQEKLRLNAEEREALEARAKQLLEALAAVAGPPPLPPPPPPAAPRVQVVQAVATYDGFPARVVAIVSSNAGKSFSAMDLAQLWNLSDERDLNAIRLALSRASSQGLIRRAAHGRYTSIA